MTQHEILLQSAQALKRPSSEATGEFEEKNQKIAELMIQRMHKRPNIEQFIGKSNMQLMETNSRNFCRFMSTLFSEYDPQMFVNTCLWAFRTYRSHGFHVTYWAVNLDTTLTLLQEECSEKTYKELSPFFDWILINIPRLTVITDEQLSEDKPDDEHV